MPRYWILNLLTCLILFLIWIVMPVAALAAAIKSSGWKKWLAWADFVLLALPLLIAGVGGMILSAFDLAWRSCMKLPCGLAFVAGGLIMLVRAGVFLRRRIERWKPVTRAVGRGVILAVEAFLLLAFGWSGLLFGAVWAGSDREVTVNGSRMVEEQSWMDWDYYIYHGPIVRGSKRIYDVWERNSEDSEKVGEYED